MKAILEFDMDEYEDREAHRLAVNATNTICALEDFDNRVLRQYTKYGISKEISKEYKLEDERSKAIFEQAISFVREKFYEELSEKDVKLFGD